MQCAGEAFYDCVNIIKSLDGKMEAEMGDEEVL